MPYDVPATGVVTVSGRTTTLENVAGAVPRTSGAAIQLFGVNFGYDRIFAPISDYGSDPSGSDFGERLSGIDAAT